MIVVFVATIFLEAILKEKKKAQRRTVLVFACEVDSGGCCCHCRFISLSSQTFVTTIQIMHRILSIYHIIIGVEILMGKMVLYPPNTTHTLIFFLFTFYIINLHIYIYIIYVCMYIYIFSITFEKIVIFYQSTCTSTILIYIQKLLRRDIIDQFCEVDLRNSILPNPKNNNF